MNTISTVYEMIPKGDGTFTARPAKPTQWIRVSAAAKILGVSSKTVLRRLEAGQLKGRKTGPTWRVDAAALSV
jgi:excisionase family DNA binding protein